VNIQSAAKPFEIYTGHGHKMQEVFKNLRSQMWWLMRLDLQFGETSNIVLPEDDELWADLCTPKFFTRNGMIHVEPKEEIKKRLGRSPNKGDAAVYWNWVRHYAGRKGVVEEIDEKPEFERQTAQTMLHDSPYAAERRRTW
jgi:hypothetical protein